MSDKETYPERERELHRSTRNDTPMEAEARTQYAIDYDDWDGQYTKPGDDPDKNLMPIRYTTTFPGRADIYTDEYILEQLKTHAANHHLGHARRPAVILKRTVTYGPWEVVDETTEHREGWY